MSKNKYRNNPAFITDSAGTTTATPVTPAQVIPTEGYSNKADKILVAIPGQIKGFLAGIFSGERKLEFHLPISTRELSEEELLAQEQGRVQRELERRAKKAAPAKVAKPKSIADMSEDELKAYQANIHRELNKRKTN